MTGKRLEGIDGVLGNLISASSQAPDRCPNVAHQDDRPLKAAFNARQPKHENPHQGARLGRPPGRPGNTRSTKEKVTLRIPSDLIAEYRDWSWEARCQLSELAERALDDYRQSRRR
jgi:uncharacterized protein (DUF4415 family)